MVSESRFLNQFQTVSESVTIVSESGIVLESVVSQSFWSPRLSPGLDLPLPGPERTAQEVGSGIAR